MAVSEVIVAALARPVVAAGVHVVKEHVASVVEASSPLLAESLAVESPAARVLALPDPAVMVPVVVPAKVPVIDFLAVVVLSLAEEPPARRVSAGEAPALGAAPGTTPAVCAPE